MTTEAGQNALEERRQSRTTLVSTKTKKKKLAFEASLMILFEYKFKATELELDGCRHFIFLHILACNELSAHLYVFAWLTDERPAKGQLTIE